MNTTPNTPPMPDPTTSPLGVTSAESNPEYNNLLDLLAKWTAPTRDETIMFQNMLAAFHEAAQVVVLDRQHDRYHEGHATGYTSGWNDAHDSCGEAVRFIREQFEGGLTPESQVVLQWAEDRITFVSYPKHSPDIPE